MVPLSKPFILIFSAVSFLRMELKQLQMEYYKILSAKYMLGLGLKWQKNCKQDCLVAICSVYLFPCTFFILKRLYIGSIALLWHNAKVLALLKVKCEIH